MSWELEWFRKNPQRFSVYGCAGTTVWAAEANMPRVLASAQKVHVLAAFLEQAHADPSMLRMELPVTALEIHHLSGSDAGAHLLALMADGIHSQDAQRNIPMTTLLAQMLYYSSNAAADALADFLQERAIAGPRTATLPPRMSAQFRHAYLGGPVATDHVELVAAGLATYQNSMIYLADLMGEVVRNRYNAQGLDALRFLPRLAGSGSTAVRGKRGQLPGHRAGVIFRADQTVAPIVGAYALITGDPRDMNSVDVARLERALIGVASGLVDLPGLTRQQEARGSVNASATYE